MLILLILCFIFIILLCALTGVEAYFLKERFAVYFLPNGILRQF